MEAKATPFLTAEWRWLVMLNYEIDPAVLLPLIPTGTELDSWNGSTYLSMVGFQFMKTRVLGMVIPFHTNFEEVNLRFYVRRKDGNGWRRAVVFIKELVPRRAIAWAARAFYNENYAALPMSHTWQFETNGAPRQISYGWRHKGQEHLLEVATQSEANVAGEGSHEEFITEHYWGYARQRDGGTVEYQVEHPKWRIWAARSTRFECNIKNLYGEIFVEFLQGTPATAFLADGSPVTVFKGSRLKA